MRWILGAALASVLVAVPAMAQVAQGPAVVGFASTSDEVSPAARARLDAFAKGVRGQDVQVNIAGHATLAEAKAAIIADGGTPAEAEESAASFAVGLSQRRASNVRSYLAAQGVKDGVMTTQAFGASRPADVNAEPGQGVAADRRVEVTTGPGSGW
jgi:outer membrane protein OmpA-like peptidoglycan-associated protein